MKSRKTTANWSLRIARTSVLATVILTLAACSSDGDNDNVVDTPDDTGVTAPNDPGVSVPDDTGVTVPDDIDVTVPDDIDISLAGQFAFVSTRAADYSSGRVDRISLADGFTVNGSYPAALSDISITTDGTSPYQIGRFQIDSVTRYDAQDTSIVDYQYSVKDDEALTANPQSIAFSDENKAYLTRRSSNSLWIIDPEATTDADFKLAEIDLGAYDIDLPNMTDAIIVDDKLFVLLERLQELPSGSQIPDKVGYLAVYNTITDTEIDTGMGSDGLLGVELLVTNPASLQYNETTGQIYVVGRGNYFENDNITVDYHSGGIQAINPTTYAQSLLLDDGTDEDNQGYFVEAEIINADLGYLLTYQSFGVSTLRIFNPTSGELSESVFPELQDVDITTIAQGSDDHLWIGINDDAPGFYRLDLATGVLLADRIATELVPTNVVFITTTQQ